MGNEENVEKGDLLKVEEENDGKDEGETRTNNILLPSRFGGWPQQIAGFATMRFAVLNIIQAFS